jgi:hypothetical protein
MPQTIDAARKDQTKVISAQPHKTTKGSSRTANVNDARAGTASEETRNDFFQRVLNPVTRPAATAKNMTTTMASFMPFAALTLGGLQTCAESREISYEWKTTLVLGDNLFTSFRNSK